MNRTWKWIITLTLFIMWIYGLRLFHVSMVNGMSGSVYGEFMFLFLIGLVFTIVSLYYVWRSDPYRVTQRVTVNLAEMAKAKRDVDPDAKMRLLLEMMDDDERYAFKQAMKERMLSGSRDGELNYDADSLGTLFDEDDYPHRHRH